MAAIIAWVINNLATLAVGVLTVFAIFYAPIIALRLQKQAEKSDDKEERKFNIFKTLLATRADTLSLDHVKALNSIDIEFYLDKKIRDCWNVYRDHLNSYPQSQDKPTQDRWEEKRHDLLTELLYAMSQYFKYDFDGVVLKKGAYSPLGHSILNTEQALVRKGLVELLSGAKAMKVEIIESNIPK